MKTSLKERKWAMDYYNRVKNTPEYKKRKRIFARFSYYLNRQRMNEYKIRYLKEKRTEAMNLLGGCVCKECGNTDFRVLQFDHVNGGGGKDYNKRPPSPAQMVKQIKENPSKYQILCANCNWIKRHTSNELKREKKNPYASTPEFLEYLRKRRKPLPEGFGE